MLWLPVSEYQYDPRRRLYAFVSCAQCAVPGVPWPSKLTSSAGQGMVGEGLELLKAAMRSPALVLRKGDSTCILDAACEELMTLPPTQPVRVVRSYEMPHLNLSTQVAHYRLRPDGALALVDASCRLHCAVCRVPDTMDAACVRAYLRDRARCIRKLLRDRRLVVEVGQRVYVISAETLRGKTQIHKAA